jgi:membrane-bound inhibitor of C-type lysozyme
VDTIAKTMKADQTTTTYKCTLTILIITNNTWPVIFDGLLIENRGQTQKIVASASHRKIQPGTPDFPYVIWQKP